MEPPAASDEPVVALSAAVVDCICSCKGEEDEAVQLQIVKAVLTAVTSPACGVHDTTLLLAVKTVYHLHLVGETPLIRATASGTLTQMLHLIFQRVAAASMGPGQVDAPSATDSPVGSGRVMTPPMSAPGEGAGTGAEEGSPSPWPATAPRPSQASRELTSTADLGQAGPAGPAHRDAFLVLRALCKLSMKPLPEGQVALAEAAAGGAPDDLPIEVRSKTLSLQLLVSILKESGAQLRGADRLVGAVKQYLCLALLKNGVCPLERVLDLSLALFLALLDHFRDHLKNEIGAR